MNQVYHQLVMATWMIIWKKLMYLNEVLVFYSLQCFNINKYLATYINVTWSHWTICSIIIVSLLDCFISECAYCEDLPIDHQYDILQPYLYHHGPEHDHRVIRESQPETYGNNTYEEVPPHRSSPLSLNTPMVQCREFVKKALYSYWEESYVSGHHIVISDPDRTVSVLEPLKVGGCSDRLIATVAETAKQSNCLVAINAGFYNTTSQACYGKTHTSLASIIHLWFAVILEVLTTKK